MVMKVVIMMVAMMVIVFIMGMMTMTIATSAIDHRRLITYLYIQDIVDWKDGAWMLSRQGPVCRDDRRFGNIYPHAPPRRHVYRGPYASKDPYMHGDELSCITWICIP